MTLAQSGRELLAGLSEMGVEVWLKGPGRLGYRATQPIAREELVACLRDWKAPLLAALTTPADGIVVRQGG